MALVAFAGVGLGVARFLRRGAPPGARMQSLDAAGARQALGSELSALAAQRARGGEAGGRVLHDGDAAGRGAEGAGGLDALHRLGDAAGEGGGGAGQVAGQGLHEEVWALRDGAHDDLHLLESLHGHEGGDARVSHLEGGGLDDARAREGGGHEVIYDEHGAVVERKAGGGAEQEWHDEDVRREGQAREAAQAGAERGKEQGAGREGSWRGSLRAGAADEGGGAVAALESLYEAPGFEVVDILGHAHSTTEFEGKVLLVVNVASACGYTASNYEGLVELYERYHKYGLEILAFPCNQFGNQESGSAEDIQRFVTRYRVTFPLMAKAEVTGPNAHPLFRWLVARTPGAHDVVQGSDPAWNFNKFLVDKWGRPVHRYPPAYDAMTIAQNVFDELVRTEA